MDKKENQMKREKNFLMNMRLEPVSEVEKKENEKKEKRKHQTIKREKEKREKIKDKRKEVKKPNYFLKGSYIVELIGMKLQK